MKQSVIYCIINIQNNHKYIGSSINFNERKRLHIRQLSSNKHHSKYLQNAWNLYGEANFIFSILEEVPICELIEKEQIWLDKEFPEYNICKIAGSSLGVKRSIETRNKLRESHLGKKHPVWRNELKSKSQKNKKKNVTKEGIAKSTQGLRNYYKNGGVSGKRKIVYQYDLNEKFIKEWESVISIEKELYIKRGGVQRCCKGYSKKSNGFIWSYISPEEKRICY